LKAIFLDFLFSEIHAEADIIFFYNKVLKEEKISSGLHFKITTNRIEVTAYTRARLLIKHLLSQTNIK